MISSSACSDAIPRLKRSSKVTITRIPSVDDGEREQGASAAFERSLVPKFKSNSDFPEKEDE